MSNSGLKKSDKRLTIIGITGGIGSGKTEVTNYLRQKQYTVIDADEISRDAVNIGEPALDALVSEFGAEILDAEGSLNRKKMADIAFSDSEKTAALNRIMFADISSRMDDILNGHKFKVLKSRVRTKTVRTVFIAAPLLFESGIEKKCDSIWLVTAEEKTRAQRAAQRDGVTYEQVKLRMANQMSEEEKKERSDVVIENNGSIETLFLAIDKLLASI